MKKFCVQMFAMCLACVAVFGASDAKALDTRGSDEPFSIVVEGHSVPLYEVSTDACDSDACRTGAFCSVAQWERRPLRRGLRFLGRGFERAAEVRPLRRGAVGVFRGVRWLVRGRR